MAFSLPDFVLKLLTKPPRRISAIFSAWSTFKVRTTRFPSSSAINDFNNSSRSSPNLKKVTCLIPHLNPSNHCSFSFSYSIHFPTKKPRPPWLPPKSIKQGDPWAPKVGGRISGIYAKEDRKLLLLLKLWVLKSYRDLSFLRMFTKMSEEVTSISLSGLINLICKIGSSKGFSL